MKHIEIYTDGACSGNPGPGGWGAILSYGEHVKEISGYQNEATNNRMELMAPIMALKSLKEPCNVSIFTDSAYVFNAFDKGWINKWQRNGWLTSQKKPVENKDLWIMLLNFTAEHRVRWNKVKGHSSNERNNRCDQLARAAIKNKKGIN